MKAKDYFIQCKETNLDKSIDWRVVNVFMQMIMEVNEIAKSRNARFDKALISIFNEQNQKANSFVKMINGVEEYTKSGFFKTDAFKHFLIQHDPDLAKMVGWQIEPQNSQPNDIN